MDSNLFVGNLFAAGGVVIGMYQRQIALIQEYGGQLELLYRRRYERGEKTYAHTG